MYARKKQRQKTEVPVEKKDTYPILSYPTILLADRPFQFHLSDIQIRSQKTAQLRDWFLRSQKAESTRLQPGPKKTLLQPHWPRDRNVGRHADIFCSSWTVRVIHRRDLRWCLSQSGVSCCRHQNESPRIEFIRSLQPTHVGQIQKFPTMFKGTYRVRVET